jgi:hypothetical protein
MAVEYLVLLSDPNFRSSLESNWTILRVLICTHYGLQYP